MDERLKKSLTELMNAKVSYRDLEQDYLLFVSQASATKSEAASALQRDQTGLVRKLKKIAPPELKHPEQTKNYKEIYSSNLGLDDLLGSYTQVVYEDSNQLFKRTARRLSIDKATVSRVLRRAMKGQTSRETGVMKENIDQLYGLSLPEIMDAYVKIATDLTRGSIRRAARVLGLDEETVDSRFGTVKFVRKRYADVLKSCFKRKVTYREIERWYVVFLMKETAELLDISPASLKTKVNEYVKDNYNKA